MLLSILTQMAIFYEDFESTNFPPSGWTNSGTRNTKWVRRTSGVVFGNASAGVQVAQTASETGDAILQTPQINLPSIGQNDSIIFSFYYRLPSVGGSFDTRFKSTDTIKVQISTDGNNWNNLVVWDSTTLYTNANNQSKKVQLDISAYQNSSVYIRWVFIDNTSSTDAYNSYFNIDSVFIGIKASKLYENTKIISYMRISSFGIELLPNKPISVSLYTVDGKKIYNSNVDRKVFIPLRRGLYVIEMKSNNTLKREKIAIE